MSTTTAIPLSAVRLVRGAVANLRNIRWCRSECIRVYGRSRGLDEFACKLTREGLIERKQESVATLRRVAAIAAANGTTLNAVGQLAR